jgi:hypothetical protein
MAKLYDSLCMFSFLAFLLRLQFANAALTCDCYTTGGASQAIYANHKFWDFRNISSSTSKFQQPPPKISDSQNTGDEGSTSDYFDSRAFTDDWSTQGWTKDAAADNPVKLVNSAQNVYICMLRKSLCTS